jgi:hypothetical protein
MSVSMGQHGLHVFGIGGIMDLPLFFETNPRVFSDSMAKRSILPESSEDLCVILNYVQTIDTIQVHDTNLGTTLQGIKVP